MSAMSDKLMPLKLPKFNANSSRHWPDIIRKPQSNWWSPEVTSCQMFFSVLSVMCAIKYTMFRFWWWFHESSSLSYFLLVSSRAKLIHLFFVCTLTNIWRRCKKYAYLYLLKFKHSPKSLQLCGITCVTLQVIVSLRGMLQPKYSKQKIDISKTLNGAK